MTKRTRFYWTKSRLNVKRRRFRHWNRRRRRLKAKYECIRPRIMTFRTSDRFQTDCTKPTARTRTHLRIRIQNCIMFVSRSSLHSPDFYTYLVRRRVIRTIYILCYTVSYLPRLRAASISFRRPFFFFSTFNPYEYCISARVRAVDSIMIFF